MDGSHHKPPSSHCKQPSLADLVSVVQDHAWIFFLSFHSSLHVSCFFSPWQKASWRSISALQ